MTDTEGTGYKKPKNTIKVTTYHKIMILIAMLIGLYIPIQSIILFFPPTNVLLLIFVLMIIITFFTFAFLALRLLRSEILIYEDSFKYRGIFGNYELSFSEIKKVRSVNRTFPTKSYQSIVFQLTNSDWKSINYVPRYYPTNQLKQFIDKVKNNIDQRDDQNESNQSGELIADKSKRISFNLKIRYKDIIYSLILTFSSPIMFFLAYIQFQIYQFGDDFFNTFTTVLIILAGIIMLITGPWVLLSRYMKKYRFIVKPDSNELEFDVTFQKPQIIKMNKIKNIEIKDGRTRSDEITINHIFDVFKLSKFRKNILPSVIIKLDNEEEIELFSGERDDVKRFYNKLNPILSTVSVN